jgi:Core-2/I-Branching enzyme
MSIAYLILAHDNPKQLSRLVKSIKTATSDIYIHIDAKSKIEPFEEELTGSGVRFTSRIPVYWADFSQVEATLILIRSALLAGQYSYLVLLSGTHYPLRTAQEIESFLTGRKAEFINCTAMPSAEKNKPISRLTKYTPRPWEGRLGWVKAKAYRALGGRHYKRTLGSMRPFGGSQWWALTSQACQYVDWFARKHPDVTQFFANTHIADEMFFQTLLANSYLEEYVSSALTFTDWKPGATGPATIDEEHIRSFGSGPVMINELSGKIDPTGSVQALFCRKVMSEEISQAIDDARQIYSSGTIQEQPVLSG